MSLQPLSLSSLQGSELAGPDKCRHRASFSGSYVGFYSLTRARVPLTSSCVRLQAGTKANSLSHVVGATTKTYKLGSGSRARHVKSTQVHSVAQHVTSEEMSASEGEKAETSSPSPSPSLVWFKHDLRIHDHAALHALTSAAHATAIPLFVFDPVILRTMEEEHLPLLLLSLASLKQALQSRGSDLVVRTGSCAQVIPALCKEFSVPAVWVEETVETSWRDAVRGVEAGCAPLAREGEGEEVGNGDHDGGGVVAVGEERAVQVLEWQAHVFEFPDPFTSDHDSYLQLRGAPLPPLPPPRKLPPLPAGIEAGSLPSLDALLLMAAGAPGAGSTSQAQAQAQAKLGRRQLALGAWRGGPDNSGADLAAAAGAGEEAALKLLVWYLAVHGGMGGSGEGVAEEGVKQRVKEIGRHVAGLVGEGVEEFLSRVGDVCGKDLSVTIGDLESLPRSSFHAIFSPSLSLGLLSPRLVHAAASHSLSLPPSTYSPLLALIGRQSGSVTAKAALETMEASQWYLHLSLHTYTSPPLPPTELLLSPAHLASTLGGGGAVGAMGVMGLADTGAGAGAGVRTGAVEGAVVGMHEMSEEWREGEEEGEHPVAVGHWRWRGILVQYAFSGTQGPPVLMVHGFGAFWQHWRGQLQPMAARGYRVWAITLPGFGRAEKPFWLYTQHTWSSCVADFIADVIQEPVVLGGNSIGGYTATLTAATHPDLVSGLVLFNSAGRLSEPSSPQPITESIKLIPDGYQPDDTSPSSTTPAVDGVQSLLSPLPLPAPVSPASSGPPLFFARLIAKLLLLYLRTSAPAQLKRCYPKSPERADDWLLGEIARGGGDPGALEVIQSVFYLPRPEPLNSLILRYNGPTIVIQGKYDPLNDAVARANSLKALCPQTDLEFVEAGHCPHDELPETVVEILDSWVNEKVNIANPLMKDTSKVAHSQ